MTPFNETPEQQTERLNREARFAFIVLLLMAALAIFTFVVFIARGIVWIRWAFA